MFAINKRCACELGAAEGFWSAFLRSGSHHHLRLPSRACLRNNLQVTCLWYLFLDFNFMYLKSYQVIHLIVSFSFSFSLIFFSSMPWGVTSLPSNPVQRAVGSAIYGQAPSITFGFWNNLKIVFWVSAKSLVISLCETQAMPDVGGSSEACRKLQSVRSVCKRKK